MAEVRRVEIGFSGGQVIAVRLEPERLEELTRVVQHREGWHELETNDGTVILDLREVAFVRTAPGEHRIGFTRDE
jgi:hypothetical protein